MNAGDYIALASVLFNVFMTFKTFGFHKSTIKKALAANRQMLASILTDIVNAFEKDSAPVQQMDPPAHAQAGAPK